MQNNPVILYIEDNADNRLLVRRILQAEGYTMVEASDAAGAIQILSNLQPDLILMDINMPDVDGFTLTTTLKNRANLSGVPIVALTANVMRGDRERSLQAGCNGYIQKPIDVDDLPTQIQNYLLMKR